MPGIGGIEIRAGIPRTCTSAAGADAQRFATAKVKGGGSRIFGADDYITWRLSTPRADWRASAQQSAGCMPRHALKMRRQQIRFNLSKRSVIRRGLAVHLTREHDILYTMMSRAGCRLRCCRLRAGSRLPRGSDIRASLSASSAKKSRTTRRVRFTCSPTSMSAIASLTRRCCKVPEDKIQSLICGSISASLF